MKRAILTIKNIKRDIGIAMSREREVRRPAKGGGRIIGAVGIAALLILEVVLQVLSSEAFSKYGGWLLIVGIAAFAIAAICSIISLSRRSKQYDEDRQAYKNYHIAVAEDVLRSVDPHTSTLVFERYGSFHIPGGKNYGWSKEFYMSNTGIYNTSVPGNTFYIAYYREDETRTPRMVYNTKFFEWNEEDAYDT